MKAFSAIVYLYSIVMEDTNRRVSFLEVILGLRLVDPDRSCMPLAWGGEALKNLDSDLHTVAGGVGGSRGGGASEGVHDPM